MDSCVFEAARVVPVNSNMRRLFHTLITLFEKKNNLKAMHHLLVFEHACPCTNVFCCVYFCKRNRSVTSHSFRYTTRPVFLTDVRNITKWASKGIILHKTWKKWKHVFTCYSSIPWMHCKVWIYSIRDILGRHTIAVGIKQI